MSYRYASGESFTEIMPVSGDRLVGTSKTWAVVADGNGARIFSRNHKNFDLVHEIHPPELLIDGLDNVGRGRHGSFGAGRHAYEPSLQESQQVDMALARSIAAWLETMFHHNRFETLILVAEPQMLGKLRNNLDKHVLECVIAESHKQLTNLSDHELSAELRHIIPGPEKE